MHPHPEQERMRYFFEIAYHGAHYHGWQSQHNAIGIQTIVENVMSKVLRSKIEIVGSGRTDAGVHCEQQFFHADIEREFEPHLLKLNLNSFLPGDIAIRSILRVRPDASARYDALSRSYRYVITRVKNPFLQDLSWHYFKAVDVGIMNEAAALLIGEQDFECFSKVKTNVNHFLCDVKTAGWTESGDHLIFRITANRFLRGMVRAVVGTLLDVGTGKITQKDFETIVKSRDRKQAGANVPARGLYLEGVTYPSEIFI